MAGGAGRRAGLTRWNSTSPASNGSKRFAIHLANLEIGAEPDALAEVATRLWASSGHLDPETAADQEFATRLQASQAAGVDFDHTVGGAGESLFERTERIPVERLADGR